MGAETNRVQKDSKDKLWKCLGMCHWGDIPLGRGRISVLIFYV